MSDTVKAGQSLAVIESPELQREATYLRHVLYIDVQIPPRAAVFLFRKWVRTLASITHTRRIL